MEELVELSEIQKFYSNRSVFLTGVSGYLGKALLEKILRSCSQVSKVYVLLRAKRGVDVHSRLQTIFASPIFDTLKAESNVGASGIWEKVQAVSGDITLPFLGLCGEERKLICKNASVVIHSAASVKFNEGLKDAMNINYYGTERVLDLCRDLKELAAFVHVSTAYANCDLDEIPEKILHPTPFPKNLHQMSQEEIHHCTSILVGKKPNTYTYTKALTESLLEKEGRNLPICIVRPSIVCSAWQEPKPGFVDSLNGITGVFAAMGKGILPSMYVDNTKVVDLIPLDVVVNVILASAWDTSLSRPNEIPVYNVCSGSVNPINFQSLNKYTVQCAIDTPATDVFRYPTLLFTTSSALNRLLRWIMIFIPFLFIDALSLVFGKKPKMVRMYNKLTTTIDSLDFFGNNEFQFVTENMGKLYKKLGAKDTKLFYWNIEDLKWEQYFRNYYLGIKSFIFKEDSRHLKSARERMSRMYWAHKAIPLFIMFLTWTIFIRLYESAVFARSASNLP